MKMKNLIFLIIAIHISCFSNAQQDWSEVEKVFGKKGTVQDNVFKVTFPRSDLKVKVGDFNIDPGLALGTWIGLMKMGDHTMMMGDLVLLDKEVAEAIKKILAEGLEMTALHNHLADETPTIKYIHFSGKGDATKLAKAIKSVIETTGTPMGQQSSPAQSNLDWSKVEAILGNKGKKNGKLLQYSFARNEKLTDSKMEMPAYMGTATGINFQMEGNKAGTTGDFVLLAEEVNPVIKALTEHEIHVTALHNHMLFDEPRLFMLHFWAVDDPEKLAKGLKAALEKTNSKK
jgi:hypothetical protein